jgi:hypothetical protein
MNDLAKINKDKALSRQFGKRKVQRNISLPVELDEALKGEADKQSLFVSELIEEYCRESLRLIPYLKSLETKIDKLAKKIG